VQLLDAVCSSVEAQARAIELLLVDIEDTDALALADRPEGGRSA
jgi:hypothetical protein